MRIPERYNPIIRIGRFFRLGDFGQKQLECGLLHAVLWISLPLALNWHGWHMWLSCVLITALAWYTWADFARFVVFESTWDPRCRKRKTVAWEMMPKEITVEGVWMCRRCYKDCIPTIKRLDKDEKDSRGLRSMSGILGGEESPRDPFTEASSIVSDKKSPEDQNS